MLPKASRRTVFSLASIYAFRMLGLFMILPIFSAYAHHFKFANATLIGLALGIYGLTQACLQLPFGMVSDRIGRKPVIVFGLILFAVGSVVAAEAHGIWGIIAGRALQGAGAIGSTLTALVADNTHEDHRLKAMSVIGMTIGMAFILAMVLGPILNVWIGLSGIFWLTAVLAIVGLIVLLLVVPTPTSHHLHRDSEPVWGQFKRILSMPELVRLDFGIFTLHGVMTALFVVVPLLLIHHIGLAEPDQWKIYLPVLVLAFFAMVPFVIIAEAKRRMKMIFCGAIIVLTLTQWLLWLSGDALLWIGFLLFCFFTAFTLLEACLPSLVAKIAPAGSKGTAMGIYSTTQFLGIFVGGVLGGVILHHFGVPGVFLLCGVWGVLWVLVALTMRNPKHVSSKIVALSAVKESAIPALQKQLRALPGVEDVVVYADEQVAYLKVDKQKLNETELDKIVSS